MTAQRKRSPRRETKRPPKRAQRLDSEAGTQRPAPQPGAPGEAAYLHARLMQLQDALRESGERYHQLFNHANDIIYTIDLQGNFTSINKTAERVVGYTNEEAHGRHYSFVLAPESLERAKEMVAREHTGGGPTTYELELLTKDGRRVPIGLSSQIIVIRGKPVGIQGIARDITDRRRAETQSKHQLERITSLYGLAELLSQTLDQHTLAENVVRACVDSFGVTLAWLAQTEPQGSLRTLAQYPRESELPQHIVSQWNEPAASQEVVGRALRTGTPAIVLDIAGEPQAAPGRASALAVGLKSAGSFPLVSRDKTLGALTLYSAQPAFFTPERIEFFRACAHQVTAAMENARLYDQAEVRLKQLQALRDIDMAISGSLDLRLTLNILLETVTSQLQVDATAILLYNDQMHMLEYGAGRGFRTTALQHTHLRLGEGHAGRAALGRRTVRVEHLAMDPGDFSRAPLLVSEGFVAYLGVPLIAKGHVKGVLEIFHRTPLIPSAIQDWQQALDGLVGQAAIAIDNAALFDDLQRSNMDLALAYDTTLEGWSRALDLRDQETEGHSQRVAEMTMRLARAMAVPETDLPHMRRGALLHDIGKIAVPDAILLKPGPLTPEEWTVMRRHPITAYELISPIAFLRHALDIPYCHHEKWDGTGYPRGLRGESIPIAARIFAVADVWDALRSDRPYRRAWTEERARAHIVEQAGTHFDPRIIEVFLRLVP